MLTELRITDLGVIAETTLPLASGLTVLTGETGAGKTMVVTALNLLLGERADSGLVRTGATSAVVEGRVALPPDHPVAEQVREVGGVVEDETILVRSVSAQGRSRAYAGGRSVPVATLAGIGAGLVTVHGQAEQSRLREPDAHRELLDRYGGASHRELVESMAQAAGRHAHLSAELRRVAARQRDRDSRLAELRTELQLVADLNVQPGEEHVLRAEEDRLAHAGDLGAHLTEAHDVLLGGDSGGGVTDLVAHVHRELLSATRYDSTIEGLATRAGELGVLAADLAADAASALADIEADPSRLAAVQQRRADLSGVLRRHGGTSEELLTWYAEAAAEAQELDDLDNRVEELQARLDQSREELVQAAAALSAARGALANELADLLTDELHELAMPTARVEVAVTQRDLGTGLPLRDGRRVAFGPHGVDDVEIQLSAHRGAPLRSVSKAASGGELSRVMLALEVVTGGEQARTFVFDEVDAGVGGAAALAVGSRLARLAETAQILVVTHLAQVAAYADHHLVVRKEVGGDTTETSVIQLGPEERETELARMLSGLSESTSATEHARELLALRGRTQPARP